eukprot:TRINITY_DN11548_c0_g1_i1.p1 TRINITY_DN11548_c0_g1~~TRINITY_DN11548_c0_g1_i1.p1  ORF type:complete len:128 (+),score=35.66 TRINITY_DN11548_c0_g1_i1:49-432(+)
MADGPGDSGNGAADGIAVSAADGVAAAQAASHGIDEAMRQRHERGECKPCAYFNLKADGCRRGAACEFCHICGREEMKAFKRNQKRKAKELAANDPDAAANRKDLKEQKKQRRERHDEGKGNPFRRG